MKITLTLDEFKGLSVMASRYGLVTEDEYKRGITNHAERASKESDVCRVWRLLKKGFTKNSNGGWKFGPSHEEAEEQRKVESGGWEWDFEMQIGDDLSAVRDGIFWLLIAACDPRSVLKISVMEMDDIFWPIAKKIRKERALRKELGIEDFKRVVYIDDPEPEKLQESKS